MDNSALQRIKDSISQSQTLVVAVGKNPSVDEMAAALSLYLSLQTTGKNVAVVSATEPIVEVSNLVGVNKVKTQFEGAGSDLVVSFPYNEGEIEKVSYTIEEGFLNIVVKAGEEGLSFSEKDVKYTRGGGGGLDLLFVVGTPRLSDLQTVFDMNTLKDVTIVNIDNKQENQGFGDIVLVSQNFSSVSEQVTQLLSDLGAPIDVDTAQNLLDGISFATGNFQSPQTSFLAFEMAGILMRQGAVRARVTAPAVPPVQAPRPRQDFAQPAPAMSQPQSDQRRPQQQQRGPQQQQRQQQQFDQRRPQQQQRGPQQQQRQQQQFDQRRPQQQQRGPQGPQQPSQPRPMPQQFDQRPQQDQRPAMPPVQEPEPKPIDDINPPTDWLTPKVYKGSSNV